MYSVIWFCEDVTSERKTRVGIVGTGHIARGLSCALRNDDFLSVSMVLTRRDPRCIEGLAVDNSQITTSSQRLIDSSDILVECSGDPIHATDVVAEALSAGLKVVTMDSELQITSGSWLARRGLITEAEGDQPGSTAALYKDVVGMGFEPVVLGNIKGFLNREPTRDETEYWAKKQGISLEQVTAFTDGTKIQIEQVLVANGLGVDIACRGLLGIDCKDYQEGAKMLAKNADDLGIRIADYVLAPGSPAGVFITARHNEDQSSFLKYYKMGDGPYYVLTRPFHLCHLEIPKTIKRVLNGGGVLLNNGDNPRISVGAIAKRRLVRGEVIKRGLGSFSIRGEAIKIVDYPQHIPIGLVFNVVLKHDVGPGEIITFDDLEVPESQALVAWQEIIKQ